MKRIITTKENTQVEVKVKEYKRAIRKGVNEEAIVETLKPAVKEDFLTAQDVAEIGSYFTISNQVQSWMSKPNIDPNLKLAIEALRAYNPDKLLHTLNTDNHQSYHPLLLKYLPLLSHFPNLLNLNHA